MLTKFVVDCVSAGRVLCKAVATAIACALVRECIGRKEFRKEGRRRERRDEEGRNRWMTVPYWRLSADDKGCSAKPNASERKQ